MYDIKANPFLSYIYFASKRAIHDAGDSLQGRFKSSIEFEQEPCTFHIDISSELPMHNLLSYANDVIRSLQKNYDGITSTIILAEGEVNAVCIFVEEVDRYRAYFMHKREIDKCFCDKMNSMFGFPHHITLYGVSPLPDNLSKGSLSRPK